MVRADCRIQRYLHGTAPLGGAGWLRRQLVILLGENTFHQVHGGIATNASVSPWKAFHEEYIRLRGERFAKPQVEPLFLGHVRKPVLSSIALSATNKSAASWERPTERRKPPMIPDRSWRDRCALSGPSLSCVQRGVTRTRYRGRLFLKSPFDIAIYLQLVQRLRPRTIVEIGSKEGDSALWFADTLQNHGIQPRVLSVDLVPPKLIDDRIEFIGGDANDLAASLSIELMQSLAHPLLVIEDSAHDYASSVAVLEFFDRYLCDGDYIVIEDGVVRFLPELVYRKHNDNPLRAIRDFMVTHDGAYVIDRELCDMYGANVTYNPNGYLRRVGSARVSDSA